MKMHIQGFEPRPLVTAAVVCQLDFRARIGLRTNIVVRGRVGCLETAPIPP